MIPRENEKKNMMIQKLWDTAKAVLRRKFIAIKSYLRKKFKNSNNQLIFTSKASGEKKQIKSKVARRKVLL